VGTIGDSGVVSGAGAPGVTEGVLEGNLGIRSMMDLPVVWFFVLKPSGVHIGL
jgi:hypothetical protein